MLVDPQKDADVAREIMLRNKERKDLGLEAVRSARDSLDKRNYILISIDTPAGRSKFPKASTVFGVGSIMSTSRLCVKTS